jgi:hypothetical protein
MFFKLEISGIVHLVGGTTLQPSHGCSICRHLVLSVQLLLPLLVLTLTALLQLSPRHSGIEVCRSCHLHLHVYHSPSHNSLIYGTRNRQATLSQFSLKLHTEICSACHWATHPVLCFERCPMLAITKRMTKILPRATSLRGGAHQFSDHDHVE